MFLTSDRIVRGVMTSQCDKREVDPKRLLDLVLERRQPSPCPE